MDWLIVRSTFPLRLVSLLYKITMLRRTTKETAQTRLEGLAASLPPPSVRRWLNEFGSPLLVGWRPLLYDKIRLLRSSLPQVEWFYAVKANDDPPLLAALAEANWGFDIASAAELRLVRQALASTSPRLEESSRSRDGQAAWEAHPNLGRVLHSHPCKSLVDIRQCFEAGIRRFVVDCENEVEKLATGAPKSRCLLRIHIPHRSGEVDLGQRFGVRDEDLPELWRACQRRGLIVDGLSFHVGSQAIDPQDYALAIEHAARCWERILALGGTLSYLDLGGGFPLPYRHQAIPPFAAFASAINESLGRHFAQWKVTVLAEPGRVVVGECMCLIASVIGVKETGGRRWYTLDDGRYGSFSSRYLTPEHHSFFPPADQRDKPCRPSWLAGPTCDGGDVVGRDYPLPSLDVGDYLVVPYLGAYASVGASRFNGQPVARTIWLDHLPAMPGARHGDRDQ